jgi:hypothetical protein
VRKPEKCRLLGRRTKRVEDVKMDIEERGWSGVEWVDLAHDRDTCGSSCECSNKLSGSIKC